MTMKRNAQFGLMLALGAAFAPSLQAELITFQYTGSVTWVEDHYATCPDLSSRVQSGDQIIGTYTFESLTAGEPQQSGGVSYPAVTTASFTIVSPLGEVRVSGTGSPGGISAVNNNWGRDQYAVWCNLPGASDNDPCTPESFSLMLSDDSAQMLSDESLPLTPPPVPGATAFRLTVDNNQEVEVSGTITTLTVYTAPADVTPPVVASVSATPAVLWPPNGQMMNVTMTASVSDTDSEVASATLIISDEYNEIAGETPMVLNPTSGLWTATVALRAARNGNDKTDGGRVYFARVRATDTVGNASVPSTVGTTVLVPHSQGKAKPGGSK
jgi:hypothetical protein